MSTKGETYPPEILTQSEVVGLMDACGKRSLSGRRDRAIICLLWRGQLRISEALALKPADFDAKKCTLRVLRGKGKKARTVVIDPKAAREIEKWLIIRTKKKIHGRRPLFCTWKGTRINPAHFRRKLPILAEKAGIAKRVHAHGLRHTGASELADEGVSLIDIQHQLGHSSAATTDKYLHEINPHQRAEKIRKRSW